MSELVAVLNQCERRAAAVSTRKKLEASDTAMNVEWADSEGVFDGTASKASLGLTKDQKALVLRNAVKGRLADQARDTWLAEHFAELAKAAASKLERLKQ